MKSAVSSFDPDLLNRQRLVVGSKMDAALDERREELQALAERRGLQYLEISSATHQGLREFVSALRHRLAQPEDEL